MFTDAEYAAVAHSSALAKESKVLLTHAYFTACVWRHDAQLGAAPREELLCIQTLLARLDGALDTYGKRVTFADQRIEVPYSKRAGLPILDLGFTR